MKNEELNYQNIFKIDDEINITRALLQNICKKRKAEIKNKKRAFITSIEELLLLKTEYKNSQADIKIKESEIADLEGNIKDVQKQISDLTALKESYEKELKSINSFTSGSGKVLKTQSDKEKKIEADILDITSEITSLNSSLQKKKDLSDSKEEEYKRIIVQLKTFENSLTNHQKLLNELQEKISENESEKINTQYNVNDLIAQRKTLNNALDKNEVNQNTLEKEVKTNNGLIEKNRLEQIKENESIENMNAEIKDIVQQINNLVKKKATLQERVKNSFEVIKAKREDESTLIIKTEQINTQIKKLQEDVALGTEKYYDLGDKKKALLKRVQEFISEGESLNMQIKELKESTSKIQMEKEENLNKASLEKDNIKALSEEFIYMKKRVKALEIRKEEETSSKEKKKTKIKFLDLESKRYLDQQNFIQKQIESSNNNYDMLVSFQKEFELKSLPARKNLEKLQSNKEDLEGKIKLAKQRVKRIITEFKKTAPPTTVVMDLIEDEIANSSLQKSSSLPLLKGNEDLNNSLVKENGRFSDEVGELKENNKIKRKDNDMKLIKPEKIQRNSQAKWRILIDNILV